MSDQAEKLGRFHDMVREIAGDFDIKRSASRAMGEANITVDEQSCKHLISILTSFVEISNAMQFDLCAKQIEIERDRKSVV